MRLPLHRYGQQDWRRFFMLALAGLCAACRDPHGIARDEFSVMTYNLHRYCRDDRDKDGQADDPKPANEIRALVRVIGRCSPDVLAVQEMGDPEMFKDFREQLKVAGFDYPYADYLASPSAHLNLAILSRHPITARQPITNETYQVDGTELPVQRGFQVVDIQAGPDYTFRLINAHLQSKRFNANGQTEMRRNEARLLNKHVRRFLDDAAGLNLLVVGDLNDSSDSRALREAIGEELVDLRPRDEVGDIWTHFAADNETYSRYDYALASAGMQKDLVAEKTRVVRDPDAMAASEHRPVFCVFRARDL